MTCDFTSISTVFQSYQDVGWMNTGAQVDQWVKPWPVDLAVPSSSPTSKAYHK